MPAAGRALLVAAPATQAQTLAVLDGLRFAAEAVDDPYAAVARLAREGGRFGTLVLSLASMLPEELAMIDVVKRRLGPIEVVVCDVDGRGASLADAMLHGADTLLAGGFLHRVAPPRHDAGDRPPSRRDSFADSEPDAASSTDDCDSPLTPDELRALLHDG